MAVLMDDAIFAALYCGQSHTEGSTYPLLYADTLKLVSRLPQRQPAASLPSRLDELFDKLQACHDRTGATRIEDAIWEVWMYDTHEGAELALERTCADIAARRYDLAETRLAILLRRRRHCRTAL